MEKTLNTDKSVINSPPPQDIVDDFSLSGEALIPQYSRIGGNPPPSTAPSQANRTLSSSI